MQGCKVNISISYTKGHQNDFNFLFLFLQTVTISADYMISLRHLDHGTPEYWSVKSQVHLRSAVRLHNLCRANRGTFVKVGQHLGTLEYLLPEEYTQTLKVLHSSAPASPLKDVKAVIREDLGQEVLVRDLIDITRQMKQRLGRTLKMETREITETKKEIEALPETREINRVENELNKTEETETKNQEETNRHEVPTEIKCIETREIEKIEERLHDKDGVKDEHTHVELARDHGGGLADGVVTWCKQLDSLLQERGGGICPLEVSRKLGMMYSEMIFVNGFVHCDPHPGNVLVRKDPNSAETQLILLDHGLYLDLSLSFRLEYCRLWLALIRADIQAIEKHSRALGAGDLFPLFACILTARPWKVVLDGIDRVPISLNESAELQAEAAHYLSQISGLLDRVPRQMLLLIKTNDLLRGVEATLRTRASASSFLVMARSCVQALDSWLQRLRISFQTVFSLSQIQIFEVLLWLQSCPLVLWLHKTLHCGLATAQG
uniref:AarF domain-containing protein kinase 1 n=1 Tax=Eptatretus burgeri TaxID=7764 RepID=A0A8C4Q9P0_EPTBU